jgi:hypothetical protein
VLEAEELHVVERTDLIGKGGDLVAVQKDVEVLHRGDGHDLAFVLDHQRA